MTRIGFPLLGIIGLMGVTAAKAAQENVPIWTRFETSLESAGTPANPVQDIELQVRFVPPKGKERVVLGFWDGGKTWRVRFSPDRPGEWTWSTKVTRGSDAGLDGKSGKFECVKYEGDNPLYQHGAIRLSANRRYLIHEDGTPFFWLADTAWNGALKATDQDWKTLLEDRRNKRFTAVQFVISQWRAGPTDRDGQVAFTGTDKVAVNPAFFQRMDRYFDQCNETGLVALPVLLWAIRGEVNPGWNLPADQCVVLVRYMVARYGAHRAIWILGGDGNYSGERAKKWHTIGREGLEFNPGRLTTIHPQGMQWPWGEFKNDEWLDILIYQSGHGDGPNHLKWNVTGPPTTAWNEKPVRPIINAEPNYEDHNGYASRKPHPPLHVRRAAYWSLLGGPPAGLTYGVHGVWSWESKPAEPLAHKGTGIAKPWNEAMKLPGSGQMKILRDFFDRLPWWDLRPADELVIERPKKPAFESYIKMAKTTNNTWAVAYLPGNKGIRVDTGALGKKVMGVWFDPRTGKFSKTVDVPAGKPRVYFPSPGRGDWLLVLKVAK